MRIPRDTTGVELAGLLSQYGYTLTKQTVSHMRMTTQMLGEHHITIPADDPLKIGTMNAILSDVAIHLVLSKDELMKSLFK